MAEQIQRMLLSNHAILEFEDLRLQLAAEQDGRKAGRYSIGWKPSCARKSLARSFRCLPPPGTSRLGFQFECDYVYTPYSLREKLGSLPKRSKSSWRNAARRQSPRNISKCRLSRRQHLFPPDPLRSRAGRAVS